MCALSLTHTNTNLSFLDLQACPLILGPLLALRLLQDLAALAVPCDQALQYSHSTPVDLGDLPHLSLPSCQLHLKVRAQTQTAFTSATHKSESTTDEKNLKAYVCVKTHYQPIRR